MHVYMCMMYFSLYVHAWLVLIYIYMRVCVLGYGRLEMICMSVCCVCTYVCVCYARMYFMYACDGMCARMLSYVLVVCYVSAMYEGVSAYKLCMCVR